MANREKRKRRLKRVLKNNAKQVEKGRVNAAWRNIFIKAGILK